MSRRRRNFNQSFEIHVDHSCLSEKNEDMEYAAPSAIDEEFPNQQQPAMEDLVDILDGELRERRDFLEEEDNHHPHLDHDSHRSNYKRPSVVSDTQEHEDSFAEQDEHNEHFFADELASSVDQSLDEKEEQEDSQLGVTHTDEVQEDEADRSLQLEEEADVFDFADDASLASSQRLSNVSTRSDKSSPRRASKRTEALIHAAAKDIVAKIEHDRHDQSGDKVHTEDNQTPSEDSQDKQEAPQEGPLHTYDGDESQFLQSGPQQDEEDVPADENHVIKSVETDDASLTEEPSFTASHRQSDAHMSVFSDADIQSTGTVEVHDEHSYRHEEGGDSSSHHGGDDQDDDDVFSDHSPRSSVGSLSDEQTKGHADAFSQKTRPPRVSDISHYDQDEDFVPTVRTTPRAAFRSPSSVKAIQMSSPPASVLGSPRSRSSRRTPMQGVSSRIGSPSLQFSPKKTPPRFRKTTPPLVLLHVTVVQLSWPWGQMLDNASSTCLSPDARNLKEAWRLLQDRAGATVLERGILLAHPQGDYEVLEERILDGLELPMRRRARILECGHYLGPSNEDTLVSETEPDSEDDYYENLASPRSSVARSSMARSRQQSTGFTHCTTCKSEIKYDALGKERIFRVKVYASNGLMRSGAWEACWKEMERVDVEVEPVISSEVQEELQRLAEEQARSTNIQESLHSDDMEQAPEMRSMDEMGDETFLEQVHAEEEARRQMMASSPPPPQIRIDTSPIYDDPRRMDEQRLREIYGDSAPAASSPAREFSPQPDDRASEYPSSPPARYLEVRSERQTRSPEQRYRASSKTRHQDSPKPPQRSSPEVGNSFNQRDISGMTAHAPAEDESLWKLLANAGRIYFQDTKNLVIGILGLAVLMFAVRSGRNGKSSEEFQTIVRRDDAHASGLNREAISKMGQAVEAVDVPFGEVFEAGILTNNVEASSGNQQTSVDPCLSHLSSAAGDAQHAAQVGSETISEVIRVVETVTQTAYATEVVVVTSTVADSEGQPTAAASAHVRNDDHTDSTHTDASLAVEEPEFVVGNDDVTSGSDEV